MNSLENPVRFNEFLERDEDGHCSTYRHDQK